MQIPGGILADRIGPRKVISSSIFIGAIGVLIFSQAPNFAISIVGRVFTALGVSVLYVNQIKVLRGWFAPEEFATALGVASSINAAGSILATLGTAASVTKFGWRSSFAFIGFLDILVGLACWVIIRNENPNWARKREISSEKRPSILLALKTCFGNSQFILLFFVALFSYGGLTGVFVAWGMSFLMQGYHLYRMTAALLMTGTSIFSLLSAPFWGRLSDKWLHARKPVLIMGLTGSVLAITPLAALANHLTIILLGITLSIMGLFTSTFVLSYAMANELVPIGIAGIASAGLNMGPYIGQGIYQFISGLILGNPASIAADGTPIYSIQAYQMIFWPSVISGIIAIFLSLRVRETIRRSKNLDMVS
jgi:MFS family permease